MTLKLHLCCRHSSGTPFLMAETCWAWFKTCCSAQQSTPLCCAAHLTPIHIVEFLCSHVLHLHGIVRLYSASKEKKVKHRILFDFFLFFLVCVCVFKGQDSVRRLSTSGANQEQMDGVMTPSPFGRPEQQCNCHSKSQHVDLCECRYVSEDDEGLCYGSEGAMANGDPMVRVTDTPPTSVPRKNSLSFSLTISLTKLSLSVYPPPPPPHAQESDDLFILQ